MTHISRRDGALGDRPPEAMSNPFRPPSEVAKNLGEHAPRGLAEISTAHWGDGRRPLQTALWAGSFFSDAPHGVMLNFVRKQDATDGADNETYESFHSAWDQAWARISTLSHAREDDTCNGHTTQGPGAGAEADATTGNPRWSDACGRAIWARLQVYAVATRHEGAELRRLLTAQLSGELLAEFVAHMGALPPNGLRPVHGDQATGFLTELILLFEESSNATFWRRDAARGWKSILDQFLVARFGAQQEFAWMRVTGVRSAPAPQNSSGPGAVGKTEQEIQDTDQAWNQAIDLLARAYLPPRRTVAEWVRYRAAAACGLISPPGWKRASRAQCRARVGLANKIKSSELRVER